MDVIESSAFAMDANGIGDENGHYTGAYQLDLSFN